MGFKEKFRRFCQRAPSTAAQKSTPDKSSSLPKKKASLGGKLGSALGELVGVFHKDDRTVSRARFFPRKQSIKGNAAKDTSIPKSLEDTTPLQNSHLEQDISTPSAAPSPLSEPLLETTSTGAPTLPAFPSSLSLSYRTNVESNYAHHITTPTDKLSTTQPVPFVTQATGLAFPDPLFMTFMITEPPTNGPLITEPSVAKPYSMEPLPTQRMDTKNTLTKLLIADGLNVKPLVTEALIDQPPITESSITEVLETENFDTLNLPPLDVTDALVTENLDAKPPVTEPPPDDIKVSISQPTDFHTTTQDPPLDPVWGNVFEILGESLEKLAMEHAPPGAETAIVVGDKSGINNRVVLVQYEPNKAKRCIRIPASGWQDKWSELDRVQLARSVHTMSYLKSHTEIPIPEIFHWDAELTNTIGAPYTIMAFVEGIEPTKLWWGDVFVKPPSSDGDEEDEDKNTDDSDEEKLEADKEPEEAPCLDAAQPQSFYQPGFHFQKVSPSLESKRQNLLRSLASSLAELRNLKFNKLGSVSFPNGADGIPEIIPTIFLQFGADNRELTIVDTHYQHDRTYKKTHDFLHRRLDKFNMDLYRNFHGWDAKQQELMHGLVFLYPIVISCVPLVLDDEEDETFVLAPPDFGSQNILCDQEGNITALIDWDGVESKPRPVGWCAAPDWLCKDWWGAENNKWPNKYMSPKDMDKYRHDYARYLQEACGDDASCDDWKYTTKSPIFDIVYEALSSINEERMLRVLKNMLARFLPDMDHEELIREIGRGAQTGDAHMGTEMMQYFYRNFRKLFGTEKPMEKEPLSDAVNSETTVFLPAPHSDDMSAGTDTVELASKKRFSDVMIAELQEMWEQNQQKGKEATMAQSGAGKRICRSSGVWKRNHGASLARWNGMICRGLLLHVGIVYVNAMFYVRVVWKSTTRVAWSALNSH